MIRRVLALAGLILLAVAYANANPSLAMAPVVLVIAGIWWFVCGIHFVQEWARLPVMLFGRYMWTYGRGPAWVEPIFFNALPPVSINDVVVPMTVPEVQTKNNVGIKLGGMLTYRVDTTKVRDSIVNVQNVHAAVRARALTTLTDVAAQEELDELLKDRTGFCQKIKQELAVRVAKWGVVVDAFELEAFSINDPSIAESIAAKARAEKEGEAGLIRAQKQLAIAKELNEAAALYTGEGRWLKNVEVLTELCKSANNNTFVIPSDMAQMLANMGTRPTQTAST